MLKIPVDCHCGGDLHKFEHLPQQHTGEAILLVEVIHVQKVKVELSEQSIAHCKVLYFNYSDFIHHYLDGIHDFDFRNTKPIKFQLK